jgi:hypothetical protein
LTWLPLTGTGNAWTDFHDMFVEVASAPARATALKITPPASSGPTAL